MTAPTDLQTLQRWMAQVVRSPDGVAEAVRRESAQNLIAADRLQDGAIVNPNDRLDPAGRLGIYANGYFARLIGVLRSDYPGLVHALEHEDFNTLATRYLDAQPSRDPNLNGLGAGFPAFLARCDHPHANFLADLATLELAMVEAFHAPRTDAQLDEASLAAIAIEAWPQVVFTTAPSLRLVAAGYPVGRYLQQVFDGKAPAIPDPERSFVAVYRKEFTVWRSRLTASAHATLAALRDGTSFGDALEQAGDDADQVGSWFREWTGEGILTDLRLSAGS